MLLAIVQRATYLRPSLIVVIMMAVILPACTARPYINQPVSELDGDGDRMMARNSAGNRAPELLVLLSLSGGGTRAAALAYGVMQELAATSVHTSRGQQRLLDEVDAISSVSGGSFVSAYYGLYGDRLFADFEQRFLRKKVQSDLTRAMANPKNWGRQGSPYYGRSDMAAEYYDQHIFDHATFADLQRPGAPLIIINSTDIGTGARIAFVQPAFNLMCSDLRSYPLSRAVMASAAVPGAATPITLQNHAGQCGYQPPQWLQLALQAPQSSMRWEIAENVQQYLEPGKRPWLHLADGGIADNLGLRAFYEFFTLQDEPHRMLEVVGHHDLEHILIISVNAAVKREYAWSVEPRIPNMAKVMRGMANIQMRRYTADTLEIVKDSYHAYAERMSTPARPIHFTFVEVSFSALADADKRAYFNGLATSLELDDEVIDRLIAVGRDLLRDAPHFQQFVSRGMKSH